MAAKKKAAKKIAKKVAKKTKTKVAVPLKTDAVEQKAKKEMLKKVREDGYALEYADRVFKADKDVVLAAIKNSYGGALEYADKALKADREVVLAAVKKEGLMLEHAHKSLKADREVVLTAIKSSFGFALEYADKSLKADRELVIAAVKRNGNILEHAAKHLKADEEVALIAVRNSFGHALRFLDKPLKANRKFVLAAVKQDKDTLEFAAKSLKADQEFIYEAVKVNKSLLEVDWVTTSIGVDSKRRTTRGETKGSRKASGRIKFAKLKKEIDGDGDFVLDEIISDMGVEPYEEILLTRTGDAQDSTYRIQVDRHVEDDDNYTLLGEFGSSLKEIEAAVKCYLDNGGTLEALNRWS